MPLVLGEVSEPRAFRTLVLLSDDSYTDSDGTSATADAALSEVLGELERQFGG